MCALLLVAMLSGTAKAGTAVAANANGVAPTADLKETKIQFSELGSGPMTLQGVQSSAHVTIGTRKDEVVVGAKLHLKFIYSPALLPDLSHLRISLNGEDLVVIPLPKADAGREIERDVDLDPRYFADYNDIKIELIGHYSLECESPQNSSLWATISPKSDLSLTLRPIELRDDLALLPAPFFDRRDNRPLTLPMVFGAHPSMDVLRSAGIIASWFGVLADYRGAHFPVSFDALPTRHAVVFATNQSRPAALNLPAVDAPTVRFIDHPSDPLVKLLVFQGKDEAQLRQAVQGFVLGGPALSGNSATFAAVSPVRRAAYDAPRWLRMDGPVKFGEIVDSAQQLQVSGMTPPPISLDLRVPPDLFTWNRAGVPLDIHYRYTAPTERDNSMLTVTANNRLLRSFRLAPDSGSDGDARLVVPLLQGDASRQSRDLLIPAFQIASQNLLQFQFALEAHSQGLCKSVFTDESRESIDPDSTIDISAFPHYAAMPNLALFANAGYPFTRYADLGETAVVLSDPTDPTAVEQLFFVLGRMGRQTGAVAMAYQLIDTQQALQAKDVDLLVLSGIRSNELVAHWGHDLALVFDGAEREYHPSVPQGAAARFRSAGSLGALMSFESPLHSGRTVVALLGSDAAAAAELTAALGDDAKLPAIRGDLTVLRGSELQSFQGSNVYYVGSLSWWQWLWFHVSQYSVLLTLISLGTAIVAALLIYGGLQRRAARRLQPPSAD